MENIDDDFIIRTIRNNVDKYGHCPFIYLWLNTNVYKSLDGLKGKETAQEYIRIHDILYRKLLELEKQGLIIKKFSHNYDGEVWGII